MSWFTALLSKIYSLGVEVPLGRGLNFTDNLRAELNPSTGMVDVSVDGAQGPTGATGPAGPTGATGPSFAGSTSIVIGADAQRAALTGVITAAQNSNTTAFGSVGSTSIVVGSDIQRAALTGVIACAQNSNTCTFGAGVGSTSIVNNGGSLERAALTGVITSAQNSNATAFGSGVASTSIANNGGSLERAALTGVVTASQNSNTTAFAAIAAKSVLANTTNGSAAPGASAGSTQLQSLRINAANNALEWAGLAGAVDAAGAVTNNTTTLDLAGTLTIPASTLAVGSRYVVDAEFSFTRGSTATALNALVTFRVGANSVTCTLTGLTTTNTDVQTFRVRGAFTVRSTGAGGTCAAAVHASGANNIGTGPLTAGASNVALACNTTGSLAISCDVQMSASVANTTITALGGDITRRN